jgi:hypothetical protein
LCHKASEERALQLEHAELTLETIRTLMERSQRYEHLSGYSGLVAGSLVLTGCAALAGRWLPGSADTAFATVWAVVFALATATNAALTANRARQRGEPVWSRQARTVTLAVLPAFGAGLAVSAALWRIGQRDLLPAVWLVWYGCGALATSFFAPRSIARLGVCCFALGIGALLFCPGWPLLTMAVGFGATHVVFGVCVLAAEQREKHERAFWAKLEEVA